MLVKDRGDLVPQLSDVRRFVSSWERDASLGLRVGDDGVIDAYETRGRIAGGTRTEMIAAIYKGWRADVDAGKSSLMIGADAGTVAELNRLARADRVAAGTVSEDGLQIAGGQVGGVGDEVFTRQNDRRLAAGSGWVKNGDRWVVTAAHADGSTTVRSVSGGTEVTLPAGYVAMHVELAYATTAFRAQGRTVDRAHAMVSPTTTREVLYVSATRGRESNRLYVDVAFDPDPATGHDGAVTPQTAHDVLTGVLGNEGREISAHEALAQAQRQADDLATLAAEYEAIARVAQQERWHALLNLRCLGPRRAEEVRRSDAYGPLIAALRRAEACGLDLESGLGDLVAQRALVAVEDVAAVLRHRVETWMAATGSRIPDDADMVAGLIPRAVGVTNPDLAQALLEREQAMERRAREPDTPPKARRRHSTLRVDPAALAASPTPESAAAPSL